MKKKTQRSNIHTLVFFALTLLFLNATALARRPRRSKNKHSKRLKAAKREAATFSDSDVITQGRVHSGADLKFLEDIKDPVMDLNGLRMMENLHFDQEQIAN